MCARNEILRSAGQGVVKRRLKATSCSRAVMMRVSDHSRHVLLGAPHLFGLRGLRNRRVTGTLSRHLRCVARLGHWHSPVAQGHGAVQMNFGNSRLNRHGSNLFAALHGLCGRLLFRSQSIPSGPGNIPPGHAAQRIVNRITWDARRVNLSTPRKVMILCLHSVQAHFLCSGIFTLAQTGIQNERQTADSSAHALACETRGGVAS